MVRLSSFYSNPFILNILSLFSIVKNKKSDQNFVLLTEFYNVLYIFIKKALYLNFIPLLCHDWFYLFYL